MTQEPPDQSNFNIRAGRDVKAAGRDINERKAFHILSGGWISTVVLGLLLLTGSWGLTKLVFGVNLFNIIGQTVQSKLGLRVGETDQAIKDDLQAQLPGYWEVVRFKVEDSENTGTRVDPLVVSRFHAVLRQKEDTFFQVDSIDSIPLYKQDGITFLEKVSESGTEVELYGFVESRKYQNSWTNSFKYDADPIPGKGLSRSEFSERTILTNSSEQDQFVAEVMKEIAFEREAMISMMSQEQDLVGQVSGSLGGEFKIRFDSVNLSSTNVSGRITWSGTTVMAIEGTFEHSELIFEVKNVLSQSSFFESFMYSSSSNIRTGWIFTMYFQDANSMSGSWKGRDEYWHNIGTIEGSTSLSLNGSSTSNAQANNPDQHSTALNDTNSSVSGFPKSTCGDPEPTDPTDYPVNFYPVFVEYSERNLQSITSQFCQDAYSMTRLSNGQRAIQVATFTNLERAEDLRDLLIQHIGSGEVGTPTRKEGIE